MALGAYHYIRQSWKKPTREMLQERLIAWREGNSVVRVDKPLRLDRARSLGYKAKTGIIVLRVRIKRGGRKRTRHKHGRKSRKQHIRKILKMNYRWVAELRAANSYNNLEVLNSYLLAKDGKYYFYEIIMIDPTKPEILNDRWVAELRAANSYNNLEVLNSYLLAKDGKYYFYEIIMIDPTKPEILNDPNL